MVVVVLQGLFQAEAGVVLDLVGVAVGQDDAGAGGAHDLEGAAIVFGEAFEDDAVREASLGERYKGKALVGTLWGQGDVEVVGQPQNEGHGYELDGDRDLLDEEREVEGDGHDGVWVRGWLAWGGGQDNRLLFFHQQ